jgi:hypothetical protein
MSILIFTTVCSSNSPPSELTGANIHFCSKLVHLCSSTFWHLVQPIITSLAGVDIYCLDTNLTVNIATPVELAITSFSNCCLLCVITSTTTHEVTSVHPLGCSVAQSTLCTCQHKEQKDLNVSACMLVYSQLHFRVQWNILSSLYTDKMTKASNCSLNRALVNSCMFLAKVWMHIHRKPV